MDVAGNTHTGRVRDRNEDTWFVDRERGLYIVADGMGGHAAGDVASRLVVRAIDGALDGRASDDDRLVAAFAAAGSALEEAAQADPGLASMGTTATVAVVGADGHVAIAHVGDSRAYLVGADAVRLTDDHTVPGSPHTLMRALSPGNPTEPDLVRAEIPEGGWLLLCSDGLTDLVEDAELPDLLADAEDPKSGCDRLVEVALERGGHDNVTVVLAHH